MNEKISFAVVAAVIVAGGLYLATRKPDLPVTYPAPLGGELTDSYSNSEMGFSLLVPTRFIVDESYTYQVNSGAIINGVKFTIPEYVAEGTNLARDSYISVVSLPDVTRCIASLFFFNNEKSRVVVENGVTYSVAMNENAGAGNRYAEMIFALPGTNPCIAVHYAVHFHPIDNYPEGSVTAFDMDALIAQFDQIRHSLVVNQPKVETTVPVVNLPAVPAAPMTIATGLNIPWELVFLPGGDMLVTERPGKLLRIGADRKVIEISGVSHVGEGGLLGLALHPRFAELGYIYLYLTTSDGGGLTNRVERYTLNGTTLSDRKVIIEGIPGASNHDGGRIAFGPDGFLYITTGDAGNEDRSQDKTSLAGKILRVGDDASVPVGNPFGNAVYSWGHRNVQGIAWDSAGQLWATEHGRSGAFSGYDELNKIVKGANYGWPEIQGDETETGMLSPQIHSGATNTWAPSGMAYLGGHVIFAGLKGEALYVADVSNGSAKNLKKYLSGVYGRLRSVTVGPDGMLYILTNNKDGRGNPVASDDRIIKIDPKVLILE